MNKKSKKWIYIIIGILIIMLIIIIFFVLGHIKKQKERDKILSKSRNEMIKKLDNFDDYFNINCENCYIVQYV